MAVSVGEEACRRADVNLVAGSLCEQCLDALDVAFVPAPWGDEMGACAACMARPHSEENEGEASPY
jgi:hypothetical protein